MLLISSLTPYPIWHIVDVSAGWNWFSIVRSCKVDTDQYMHCISRMNSISHCRVHGCLQSATMFYPSARLNSLAPVIRTSHSPSRWFAYHRFRAPMQIFIKCISFCGRRMPFTCRSSEYKFEKIQMPLKFVYGNSRLDRRWMECIGFTFRFTFAFVFRVVFGVTLN